MKRNSLTKTSNFPRFPVCSYFRFFNHFSLHLCTITASVILTFISIITPYFEKNKSRVIAVIACHLLPSQCRLKTVAWSTPQGLNPPSQKCFPPAGVTLCAHLSGTVLGVLSLGPGACGFVPDDTTSWFADNTHPFMLNMHSQWTASPTRVGAPRPSLLYLPQLEQAWTHSTCLITICWINK